MAKPQRYDDNTSSSKRGYGYKWQRAREGFLKKHPLCADHIKRGHVVEATVVDHIVPHRRNQELFWDSSNWQPLCKQCHDSHKKRLEMSGIDAGCGVDGVPMDSNHHWNK